MEFFTINELTRSGKAQELGINNDPNHEQRAALIALVENTLDPLRRAVGCPVYTSSGFRSPELNTEIKGSENSA